MPTRVGQLFETIAPRYDLINDLQSLGLHRRWKRLLVEMANVQPGEAALDLCCGTGDIAFNLQRAGAEVVGLDFTPAMLELARRRGGAGPAPKFLTGDVMNLPFTDHSFDIVTIGYGLRNLESWERGLEEMARVARPGGRLLILEFGKPENRLWRRVYFAYLKFLVPLFGKIFCHNSALYAYIYDSLQKYPAQRGVTEKLKQLGCRKVEVLNLMGGAMSIHRAIAGD
jgi:demethylmenaquinone methyltransferase/2-methoxy-6-polyprenyl-1,4-benzoquinol methylase